MARLDGCCSKCGDLLTESNWASHKRRNRSYECVTCQRDYELRRRYGIGNDEYQAIFEAQRGLCAICGVTKTRSAKRSLWIIAMSRGKCGVFYAVSATSG